MTPSPQLPAHIDDRQLSSYLQDHLTGASAGRARAQDMAKRYAGTPLGPRLDDFAHALDAEHARVAEIVDQLGLRQPLAMRVVARAGELAGRLKPNGRLLGTPATTPLLELELMRSAVNGKQGLWQTLGQYADDLGLPRDEMEERTRTAGEQSAMLEELHALVRPDAFRPE